MNGLHKDLAILQFLSGDLESADEFNGCYERMLNECKTKGDKETVRRMQRLLFQQAAYLMNQWIIAKADCGERVMN